jgi:ankyrin repeat protein
MRPSLEAAGAFSSSFSTNDESYNLFLPYAQESWLFHTTQLCRTTHRRTWHLWKRLVSSETKIVLLPWTLEDCIELRPPFVDFVLTTRQWNVILVYIGRANASALRNLEAVYEILHAQAEVQALSLAKSEEIQQLRQLLARCTADPEAIGHRYVKNSSALQIAAYGGLTQCTEWLLENGAAVNLQGGQYGTALQAACTMGHEAIVRILLENGAEVNLQGGKYDTALQGACGSGTDFQGPYDRVHEAVVKLLLDNGADVNLQGGYFGTALQAACIGGSKAVVKLLHANGADLNLYGGKCDTALPAACGDGTAPYDGVHEAIVKLLLNNGADVNLQGGYFGTALHAACIGGNRANVKLLLESGAKVNIVSGQYGTALQAATRYGRPEIVRLLFEHGAK